MISQISTAKIRRTFPAFGTPGDIFRPDIYSIKTGDYILGKIDSNIIIGRIVVERKIIKSIIHVKIHNGTRIGNKRHLITISDIICFTRALTPKKMKEELIEFFI